MKKLENITFLRWGNLNPVKHREGRLSADSEERTYHSAPVFKGIYAFPEGFVERFLLGFGSMKSFNSYSRSRFIKDENGNRIKSDDFWSWDDKINDLVINPKYYNYFKKLGIKKKSLSSCRDDIEPDWLDDENTPDEVSDKWYEDHPHYLVYDCNVHKFKYTGEIWHHLGDNCDKQDILGMSGSWVKTTYKNYIKALKRSIYKDKFIYYLNYTDRSGDPHSCKLCTNRDRFEVFIEKVK